jgi:hypothetical protein
MPRRVCLGGGAAVAVICLGVPFLPSYPDSLLREGRVFDFRDAVLSMKSPGPFYRGAVAYSLHDWATAERELVPVVRAAPFWSRRGYTAAQLLEHVYDLSGRNTDARAGFDSLGWRTLLWDRALFTTRAQYGDFVVAAREPSTLRYATLDSKIYVPLTINGRLANYAMDTGSSDSFLSETEARRLGLTIDPYNIQVGGYSRPEQVTGIAVTPELRIGKFLLRNVSFLVQPDKEMDGDYGLIGLPLLFALETIRWSPDGKMEIGFPPAARNDRTANLALTDQTLLARAGFGNDYLDLQLDTGADTTRLYPRFRRTYTAYLRLFGRPATPTITGNRIDRSATELPEMPLRIGDSLQLLRPAYVFSENPSADKNRLHGGIGFDFLSQAATVTLDFHAMQLTMAGDGLIASRNDQDTSCRLPRGLVCPLGWKCTVKPADDSCQLDRVPVTPWPGNPFPADALNPNEGHTLDPGFRLREGQEQTITFRSPSK